MTYVKTLLFVLPFLLVACGGEEYYATPQKTLERYLDNRMMSNRGEYESCLNAFRKEDREWMEKNYLKLCSALYGSDCPGEGISTVVTVWTDAFEPAGPKTSTIESSTVDDDAGTAVLVVDGKEIEFVRSRGNWKIKGFFGVVQKLKEKYPQIDAGA